MTIEQYYRWINTKAGKKIKDFMNLEDDEIKSFRFK